MQEEGSGGDGLEEALAPGRLMAALSPQYCDALALTLRAGVEPALRRELAWFGGIREGR